MTNDTARFVCIHCHYETNRKNDWTKHVETKKHKRAIESEEPAFVLCDCGKAFKHHQSLYRHRKICDLTKFGEDATAASPPPQETTPAPFHANGIILPDTINDLCITEGGNTKTDEIVTITEPKTNTEQLTAELLIQLIKQNEELRIMMAEQHSLLIEQQSNISSQQAQIMELCKQPKTIKNNFNLNFFLNVQCKDALNIQEFVNNLAIKISDIENVGRMGYVEGISRIILDALQQIDMYKRPIHCMDLKREVLFVKDEDKWDRDDNNVKMKRAISNVAQKNCKTFCSYIKPNMMMTEHPDCEKNLNMMKNVNGGDSLTREKNHDKIISIISKGVAVEQAYMV
jgi:hypothetical protein